MQSSLEELRERIRRLEAENQRLLEYAEKTRLDGLTAESINNVQIGTTFLGNGTEKIREINGALGPGVEERIQELNRTNKQLQNEIKECRRSEKTLKESENKFRELFHKALDAIYLWEVRDDGTIGRCLEVNDVACKMLGFSRAEILSFTPRDLDDEESARKISGIVKELTARGNKRFEMTHVTKDGRKVPVEINAHIFSLNDKKVVLSLARDITERRRAQEALRESEQRFKTAFLTSPDAININRLEDGLYIDVNLGFTALTGYTRDDVIGKTSLEINIWHDPADRERLVAGLQRSGQVSNLEAKFRIKDGRVRTGLMSAKVIELDEIPHVLSITRDIEDMKKAEEELLRLATAVEQAAESIIVTDKDGTIKYVNPAFEKTMGYNGEEMIGQNIRVFKSNGHKEAYSKIWHIISSGMVWSGHIVSRAKDGRLREFETTISPIRNRRGRIVNFVSVSRDVTQEVALESRLRQAQKMESVGTLAGGIAHDFNNILSAIIGYVELTLADLPADSRIRNNQEEIYKAAQRARELVKQILAFSRQSEPELKPVQISPIVQEALKLLRASLPTTIEIRQSIQDRLGNVLADSTQIHQVLMNLCANAAHAMQENGGILKVDLTSELLDSEFTRQNPELNAGRYLKLTVADTGHGIPPEFLDRIFDPYFTTKEKGEGTGLGLAVVHGIARSHGGTITAHSEPDKGSIFSLYLPVIEKDVTDRVETAAKLPTGTERIIFIDDEKSLTDLGKMILERLGYEVETRTSSLEALELFRATPGYFDLVITDMTMPHLTGDRLSAELLRIRPDLPIILCTGFSHKITERKAKAMGIKAFIMKPIIMTDLAISVRQVLDAVKSQR